MDPFEPEGIRVALAKTRDFRSLEKHPVTTFNAKAMALLQARLLAAQQQKQQAEQAQTRKLLIGSGDRSERIRTYNFPQGRVTDHRIGFTTHQLYLVLQGEPALDEIIDALITEHQTTQLASMQEEGHG